MEIELHHLHPGHDDEVSRLKARIAELETMNHDLVERVTENDEIRLHWEEIEQTRAENERIKARIAELELQFGWRSFKNDPPKANGMDDFVFCGHQRYAYQSEAETEYFVDYGCLDMNETLCMFNDWHEGQEIFEIDYWFPLPRHPDEPKKETKEKK